MTSVPVMSAGIRSGVNWMRLNERLSESASVRTIRVLASPGTPCKQAVPAGEHSDQQLFDHLPLADDHLAQLVGDLAISLVEPLDSLVIRFRHRGRLGVRCSRRFIVHDIASGVIREKGRAIGAAPVSSIIRGSGHARQVALVGTLQLAKRTLRAGSGARRCR